VDCFLFILLVFFLFTLKNKAAVILSAPEYTSSFPPEVTAHDLIHIHLQLRLMMKLAFISITKQTQSFIWLRPKELSFEPISREIREKKEMEMISPKEL
jgi:hypothetical protein